MDAPVREPFEDVMALEPAGEGRFRAELGSVPGGQATFGGHVMGLAARALAPPGEARPLHAFHASFLRPVPPGVPVELVVTPLSEGRRFARRRVEFRHEGRLLFEATGSLAAPADGAAFQAPSLPPGLPAPEGLPEESHPGPVAWRRVDGPDDPSVTSAWGAWVRPCFPLTEDDPGLQAAALLFLSDAQSQYATGLRLGVELEPGRFVSLNQAIWFHRLPPWRDFRWIASESDLAEAGRVLTRRRIFERDGSLVASVAQEALLLSA